VNAILLALTWTAMNAALEVHWALSLALAPVAAGLVTRLFIIQHDCGHGSFFRTRRANDRTGRLISAFSLIPYDFWRRTHAAHHATSGNLSKRGCGDVDTLTVDEYRALSPLRRLGYRIYRDPIFLLLLGCHLYFMLKLRLPWGQPEPFRKAAPSILGTNLLILAWIAPVTAWLGWDFLLLVWLPTQLCASSLGLWLFYIQHQYAEAYWARDDEWDFHDAALKGSSHYDLPVLLRWFTGNIGAHHVHHLCSKVPNYRLYECLRDHPDLAAMNRITLLESLPAARLALWDERRHRLVGFGALRESPTGAS
jgi:omega-6 fatty acid desaturase (delta-12 desaturase)